MIASDPRAVSVAGSRLSVHPLAGRESGLLAPILMLDAAGTAPAEDPGMVILTCANCGAAMDERKCKLICRCGYFLSCSDYY
jgi:hypothetical protein